MSGSLRQIFLVAMPTSAPPPLLLLLERKGGGCDFFGLLGLSVQSLEAKWLAMRVQRRHPSALAAIMRKEPRRSHGMERCPCCPIQCRGSRLTSSGSFVLMDVCPRTGAYYFRAHVLVHIGLERGSN